MTSTVHAEEELSRQRGLTTHTQIRLEIPFHTLSSDGPQPNSRPYMASQRRQ